jgi:hypothetical protein
LASGLKFTNEKWLGTFILVCDLQLKYNSLSMRPYAFTIAALIFFCPATEKKMDDDIKKGESLIETAMKNPHGFANGMWHWTGNINRKYPIFLWIDVRDNIIQGSLTYLNAKNPVPIKLMGKVQDDGGIRICEYRPDAKITGIFDFENLNDTTRGTWFNPKNQKEFHCVLVAKDTMKDFVDTSFELATNISGSYSYSYGDDGGSGWIGVKEIGGRKVRFEISCVTSAPGYHLADVDPDTAMLNNDSFIYKMPDAKTCDFKVTFYKHFVDIEYLHGYRGCESVFGQNADVDGLFLKTSNKPDISQK